MNKALFLFILQIALPILALASLYFITLGWALVSILVFFLFRCVGYTATYHRVITHQTHKLPPAVEFICLALGFYGSMSTPLEAASIHINHHKYVDTNRDPHSPKYIGWRAAFPLFWVDKDKGDYRTIARLSKNPRVMFFQRYYWILVCLPVLLLLISFKAFLFLWLVPAACALVTLSWSTFNHDDSGAINRGLVFGILTGGEHRHVSHHIDSSNEGFISVILDMLGKRNGL